MAVGGLQFPLISHSFLDFLSSLTLLVVLWVVVPVVGLTVDGFGCSFLGSCCGFERWRVGGGLDFGGYSFAAGFDFGWYQFCFAMGWVSVVTDLLWVSMSVVSVFQWVGGFGGYGFAVGFDFGGLGFPVGGILVVSVLQWVVAWVVVLQWIRWWRLAVA